MHDPGLVTGDAVVLDVPIAQLPVRAVGALIDIAVVAVGYVVSLALWAVTLRGPVNTPEEKAKIEAAAKQAAGASNVRNELEVTAAR